MSKSSQPSILGAAFNYPAGQLVPRHRHRRAQLVFAASGTMTVRTREGLWVVPPHRALWIPPLVTHSIRCGGPVAMRTLYLSPTAIGGLPRLCRVVDVSPLLRELVLACVALPSQKVANRASERLRAVLFDQIRALEEMPLQLVWPKDPRARNVADQLSKSPGDARTLAAWGRAVGASSRTLARVFARETRMAFAVWRRQLRLLRALEQLSSGIQVTEVAMNLGYQGPSAFISMFRRQRGETPGAYLRRPAKKPAP